MRLSEQAIIDILSYEALKIDETNECAYWDHEDDIIWLLKEGKIADAEFKLLYDPRFGFGFGADRTVFLPKNEAIKQALKRTIGTKHWHRYPDDVPPDVPSSKHFGVDYEVKYLRTDIDSDPQLTQMTVSEWLPDKTWNCIYPVIAWRECA